MKLIIHLLKQNFERHKSDVLSLLTKETNGVSSTKISFQDMGEKIDSFSHWGGYVVHTPMKIFIDTPFQNTMDSPAPSPTAAFIHGFRSNLSTIPTYNSHFNSHLNSHFL